MSGLEKLLPCSKVNTRRDRSESSNNILFVAFFIFSLATILFVSYVAVDHAYERNKLVDEIDKMENHLEKLKSMPVPHEYSEDDTEISRKITDLIEKKRKCDPNYAIVEQMEKHMTNFDKADLDFLKIWNTMPKPFLHLTGKKLSTEHDEDNVDGMETVIGWETMGGGDCTDSDPKTDGKDIIIPRDGNYSIYSQLTFHHKSGGAPMIHRHVVQYIETFASIRDDPKILMENDYQLNEDGARVSYQAGVYRFNVGDILRVLVSKDQKTKLQLDGDEGGGATFGLYIL